MHNKDKRYKYFISIKQKKWLKMNYPILGVKECSEHVKTSKHFIQTYAYKNNLKVSHKKRSQISREHAIKQFAIVRQQREYDAQLITIITPEQSYILGYLWGDGHLAKANIKTSLYYAQLEIVTEDMNDIKEYLNSLGRWKIHSRQRTGKEISCAMCFDNVLGLFLKINKYDKKSTEDPCLILSKIPTEIHKYFWRGYCDADGCFYVNKNLKRQTFSICGHYIQPWTSIEMVLKELNVKYSLCIGKNSKNQKHSSISIYNIDGIRKFGNFIYGDKKELCLKRKYEKFLQIIG